MLPDLVNCVLHAVFYVCGHGNHGILFRKDYYKLAVCAVGAEGTMAAAPHLIAVALYPVAVFDREATLLHLLRGGSGGAALHLL